MTYLVDTNILLRLVNPADPQYPAVVNALAQARQAGNSLYITPQNLVEFRHVATRPTASNGFGWTAQQTATVSSGLEVQFAFLPEIPLIFQHWKSLVGLTLSTGRTVHDARLAAVALAYGITQILTFNGSDFNRFAPFGVSPVDPATF